MLDITNHITRMINLMDRETWSNIVYSMKKQCFEGAIGLIVEFEKCFSLQKLSGIKIVYLQYWLPTLGLQRPWELLESLWGHH
jgi:hypothetical protein